MDYTKLTKNKRPSKSYFYKLLHTDIANELKKNEKIGFIDFACGNAQLAIKFNFKSYTGIDTDKKKILINKDNFPDHYFFNEDISSFTANEKGDVVCCIETFGFNKHFDNKEILKTLNNIANNIRVNGSFYFNMHKEIYIDNIDEFSNFFKLFEKYKLIYYGNFTKKKNVFLHKILYFFEKFYSGYLKKGNYLYVKCEGLKKTKITY